MSFITLFVVLITGLISFQFSSFPLGDNLFKNTIFQSMIIILMILFGIITIYIFKIRGDTFRDDIMTLVNTLEKENLIKKNIKKIEASLTSDSVENLFKLIFLIDLELSRLLKNNKITQKNLKYLEKARILTNKKKLDGIFFSYVQLISNGKNKIKHNKFITKREMDTVIDLASYTLYRLKKEK